ncbi:pleiotropic drug resistance protein 1-like [Humulus lupulus]|uniref:pleiotropic drug resistance protein 1-like n=1 Tax=Humulus lupulus TaxID=3486 RepID=UPI002B4114D7|nr:pleiotropic drug resistance protein 1-like [Humulus lupulus]
MEISNDVNRASNSSRSGNSSLWRNNSNGVFERLPSSRREEDEEDLHWFALEKLPTYTRLKKGLLTTSRGEATEIDIHNLGLKERKILIERLVAIAEEGNEKFLHKLKNRIDRVGIELPSIEVRFEHLNVETEAYVGTRALPTFFNAYINVFEVTFPTLIIIIKHYNMNISTYLFDDENLTQCSKLFLQRLLTHLHILSSRKKHLTILDDVSGIIKPGRMTLLLGPPSSGKTTLLLALAGKLDQSLKFSGRVTYNGHDMDEFVPCRTAAYISQYDVHIGEMTVRETLAFSARCQGVGSRYDMLSELSRREQQANIKPDLDLDVYMKAAATEGQETNVVTDYILRILGLEVCADTMVGDEMLRGISGGQRKRVTTGEMLVGPANALFMDEISSGLDSSTTYQIVNSLKQCVRILNGTTVISLLQPPPETFELFDDVIILSDGQVVYQGPREQVLDFFEFMGFKCPERKGVADFLQEVTSKKDQEQYWVRDGGTYKFITAKEFADAYRSFQVGLKLEDELATPFDKRKNHKAALTTKKYGVKKIELLKACFSRELLLMRRNSFVYIFKLVQLATLALITTTVFLRTNMHHNSVEDGGVYMGALFFSVAATMFNGMSEISMTIAKLPVFYKQKNFLFFPSWAFALPTWILKIPISFIEAAVWVIITYYPIGFEPNLGRFFKQYLLIVTLTQMASGLCRLVAATTRDMITGGTVSSLVFLLLVGLSGFVLSRDDIKKWWMWGYWISPMMYGQNALAVNEFLGRSWRQVLPNSTEPLGIAVLKSRGFFLHEYWYWIGVGALIVFVLVFNILFALALTCLNAKGRPQAVKSEDGEVNDGSDSSSHITQKEKREDVRNRAAEQKKGMILPFEPHSISFDNITYSVDMPEEMKNHGVLDDKLVLLNGISGCFRPGVLTALMGVSGAGKTTLMDVLAGRKTGGYVEGDIRISGYPKNQETFTRVSGYCEQNDIHSPHVTVYESLLYSAWLRLPSNVDSQTRKLFIEEVMELVELSPLRQALVGLPGVNGLSTEQRKRLTIAVELVANPSIIFMDEPTSGLDARSAAIVMRAVRNTVDTGRTVVCTIHQPSIDIFEAFDELLLLKRGGEEIYVGPLGRHSCHLINYFEGINGVSNIKDGSNPATWMLEVTTSAQEMALGVDFADVYKNSELYRRNKEAIKGFSIPSPGSKELHFPSQYSQSFLTQCIACLWKQHKSHWRNPPYTAVRLLFSTIAALIFGTMFWDLGSKRKRQQSLMNAVGSMYAAVPFAGSQNASAVQPIVSIERTVFYRERAAGMYSPFPYTFAQVVIEIPYNLAQATVYSIIVYTMIGFELNLVKYLWNLFFTFFALSYYTYYGMMMVGATPNVHIASVVSSAFYGIWNLFSGFMIPKTRIPIWWIWYYWLSPVAWTLYGLVVSQYGDVKEELENGETVQEFVRRYFGYDPHFLPVVALVNVAFTVTFAFIFALSIRLFNFERR